MSENHEIAIKVEHISKIFHEQTGARSFKEAFVGLGYKIFGRKNKKIKKGEFQALRGVNFEVKKGEFFGIVGRNGSGKSTLLKIIAGVYTPTKGAVTMNGNLTPFIELGVGFNPELSGKDNVYLNGALLGFNRKQMDEMYDDIVDFAELKDFMGTKLKNYSSGMQVRLAFSVAIRAESDILLIDEVLAVGDAAFQTKCFNYFSELKAKNTTVIFVSHDRASLERFCEKGILVDSGNVVMSGDIKKVLKSYNTVVLDELEGQAELDELHDTKPTHARIRKVEVTNGKDVVMRKITYGERISVKFEVEIIANISNPVIGVTIWQRNIGKAVYAMNTLIDGMEKTGDYNSGDIIYFKTRLPEFLNDGEYYVEPAIANESTSAFYDQRPKATKFFIVGSDNPHALLNSNEKVIINRA